MTHCGIACTESTKFPSISTAVTGSERKLPTHESSYLRVKVLVRRSSHLEIDLKLSWR